MLRHACSLLALAENRGADSHPGRAGRHRRFEIAGHAHRERVERDASSAQLTLRAVGQLGEQRRCSSKSSRGGGMHIRPRSCRRGSAAHAARQRSSTSSGGTPPLPGSSARPHLDAYIERRRVVRRAARSGARRCARDPACGPSESARRPRASCSLCSWPVKCQVSSRSASCGELRAALPAGSSRRSHAGRSSASVRIAAAGCALADCDQADGIGIVDRTALQRMRCASGFPSSRSRTVAGGRATGLHQPKSADQLTY